MCPQSHNCDSAIEREVWSSPCSHLQTMGELDGVVTFCEMAVPLVARLAEKLGVPGNTPASIDAARDKSCTRAVMQAASLPSPKNLLISEPTDVAKAAAKVGFPAGGAFWYLVVVERSRVCPVYRSKYITFPPHEGFVIWVLDGVQLFTSPV